MNCMAQMSSLLGLKEGMKLRWIFRWQKHRTFVNYASLYAGTNHEYYGCCRHQTKITLAENSALFLFATPFSIA